MKISSDCGFEDVVVGGEKQRAGSNEGHFGFDFEKATSLNPVSALNSRIGFNEQR